MTSPAAPPTSHPRRALRRSGVRGAMGLVVAATLAACALPTAETPSAGREDGAQAPLAAEPPDPSVMQVRDAVEELTATIEAARAPLAAAATADDLSAARRLGAEALASLVRDRGQGAPPPTGPLFPDETADRGQTEDADDRFTLTLTAAREGGAPGSALLDLLRDPIAGDLGSWQRDAAGVLASIEATVAGSASLEQREVDVGELAGLGPRAIAWTLLVLDAPDRATATAAAERGAANLEVVLATLDRFAEGLDPTTEAEDDGDDEDEA